MANGSDKSASTEVTPHSPIKAMVLTEFTCERRNGSCVTIPRGPSAIELETQCAVIYWQARYWGKNRAEISHQVLDRLLNTQRIVI